MTEASKPGKIAPAVSRYLRQQGFPIASGGTWSAVKVRTSLWGARVVFDVVGQRDRAEMRAAVVEAINATGKWKAVTAEGIDSIRVIED